MPDLAWSSQNTVAVIEAAAWPVVVLVLASIALMTNVVEKGVMRLRSGGLKSVKAFGVEVELSAEVAEKNAETFETVVERYVQLVDTRLISLMRRDRLLNVWESLVRDGIIQTFNGTAPEHLRCTLYVPDPLLDNVLYQLVDYYPKGGGRGRRLSWRFGAVGRAWRLEQDDVWPGVETDPEALIEKWGMSRSEADTAGRGRTAFGCILLRRNEANQDLDQGEIVALLYMDSDTSGLFGQGKDDQPWLQRAEAIKIKARELGLAPLIDALLREIRTVTPALSLSRESSGTRNAIP